MPGAVNFDNYGAGSNFETVYMEVTQPRNHVAFITDPKGVIVKNDERAAIDN